MPWDHPGRFQLFVRILDVRGLITIVVTILWRANGEILCSAFAFLPRLHAGTNMLHQTPAIGHLVDG